MKLTFLESASKIPLTKTITPNGSRSYPNVKMVNSYEFTVPSSNVGLTQFDGLLRSKAAQGMCLLKGSFKKQLVAESRARQGDRFSMCEFMVLDLDGVRIPGFKGRTGMTAGDIESLAESALSTFPPEFREVSYIAQASSSLGHKADAISMHIFILLSFPMPVNTVKMWLRSMNLTNTLFSPQVTLAATGQALRYPLDPSVADNTKLIFIAPPAFVDGAVDPFVTPDDRIVLVLKDKPSIDLVPLVVNVNPERLNQDINELKDELRIKQGYNKKKTAKIISVNLMGEDVDVLANPDKMSITILDESSHPYIRCNINGGDSGAYYFLATNPLYMFNFKDEPAFDIHKADADFYKSVFDKFKGDPNDPNTLRPLRPMVMRDFDTNTLYNAMFDPNTKRFSREFPLTETSMLSVAGFMQTHGHLPPSHIPDAKIVFDPPHGDRPMNLEEEPYYINLYQPTKYMLEAEMPGKKLNYETAHLLGAECPRIYALIYHILGNGDEELKHFVNWLAYIYQERKKTTTAWVLGGIPGTGKGVFVSHVLRPLFGPEHVPMKTLENLEEQFNSYMHTAQFLVVDEFRMGDAKNTGASRIADKLKNLITEPRLSVRAMRSNQVEVDNFTNFIFLTNRNDAINLEGNDRRYNVAPRQERTLRDVHPKLIEEIPLLKTELKRFAGVLDTFRVNASRVTIPLSNAAKTTMHGLAMSVADSFCADLSIGKLESFEDVLSIETTDTFNAGRILSAQRIVKSWLADAKKGEPSHIPAEHMRIIYHVLNEGNSIPTRSFMKMIERRGIVIKPNRLPGGKVVRCYKVTWCSDMASIDSMIENHFLPADQPLLRTVNS